MKETIKMPDTKLYIGIDPGKTGAIVFLSAFTNELKIIKCPKTRRGMRKTFIDNINSECRVVLERVHAMPHEVADPTSKTGKKFVAQRGMFPFGQNYGRWEGLMEGMFIEFEEVLPRKWQAHFGKMPKDKTERKNRLWDIAQAKFPNQKVYKYAADAVLITLYCKDVYGV